MPLVQSNVDSFVKAIFHAFKFPTQPVFGLLVGKRLQDTTFVVDAIPIMHTLPAVSPHPVLETAVSMVSSYTKTQGLVVLGLYAANERLNDESVNPHTQSVIRYLMSSDKVSSSGAGIVVWQLQNEKLKPSTGFEGAPPMLQYLYSGEQVNAAPVAFAQWNGDTCTTRTLETQTGLAAAKNGVLNFEYCKLVDFEEHLENVSLDFFNEKTVKIVV